MTGAQLGGREGAQRTPQLIFQPKALSLPLVGPRSPIKAKAKSSLEINKQKVFVENTPSAISLLRQPTGSWPNFCSSDQNPSQVLEKFWTRLPGATPVPCTCYGHSSYKLSQTCGRRGTFRKRQLEGRRGEFIASRFIARVCPGGWHSGYLLRAREDIFAR